MDKIGHMAKAISTWNKNYFGNIFWELDCLQWRIQGIQRSSAYPTSALLHFLETNLQTQYAVSILLSSPSTQIKLLDQTG